MGEPTRRDIVDQLYALLEPLASLPGQGEPLGTLTSEHVTTSHGVYLFHEPGELREGGRPRGVEGVGLPGVYIQYEERIAEARRRVLAEKCGVRGITEAAYRPLTPRDEPDRDSRRRTISLGSWAPAPPASVSSLADGCVLGTLTLRRGAVAVTVDDRPASLVLDHLALVREAVAGLGREVDHLSPASPAVRSLLPETFTYRDVNSVLRAVADLTGGDPRVTNALRRRLGTLTESTGNFETLGPGQTHRPAELRRWV